MPDLTENSNNFPSTFSRASTQYTALGGTLTEYATDVPAFGDTGLSAQKASTNTCAYSDDLTGGVDWFATNLTPTGGQTSPQILGRNTSRLVDSGSGGGYIYYNGFGFSSSSSAVSCWLVTASGSVSVTVGAYEGPTLKASKTVTVTTTPQRVVVVGTGYTFAGGMQMRITINDASATVYANLCQIEESDTASDEIPTSGASATRAVSNTGWGVAGLPTNDVKGSFTFRCPEGDGYVMLGIDTNLSDWAVYVSKDDYGLVQSPTMIPSIGVGAVDTFTTPLTEGSEYTCEFSLSLAAGGSITINGETATDLTYTSGWGTVNNLYPNGVNKSSGSVSSTSDGFGQTSNLKIEDI